MVVCVRVFVGWDAAPHAALFVSASSYWFRTWICPSRWQAPPGTIFLIKTFVEDPPSWNCFVGQRGKRGRETAHKGSASCFPCSYGFAIGADYPGANEGITWWKAFFRDSEPALFVCDAGACVTFLELEESRIGGELHQVIVASQVCLYKVYFKLLGASLMRGDRNQIEKLIECSSFTFSCHMPRFWVHRGD